MTNNLTLKLTATTYIESYWNVVDETYYKNLLISVMLIYKLMLNSRIKENI